MLRCMCVDQSTIWMASLSWLVFVLFTIVVPGISHFVLACSTCDSKHDSHTAQELLGLISSSSSISNWEIMSSHDHENNFNFMTNNW
ncbi:hypothetical protein F8388_008195 [Cannabis sativa]|uniref:Uncharacterized protein n=1 Tax=Cannabis sativa TaxID=3483 RepID=A0A7J6EV65_CANSA|nr:hypothetical protein F8388_008195 [Cannabis sativa]KAF4391299.1 hypothetical protein G4B88_016609 [Cannabis sativa]